MDGAPPTSMTLPSHHEGTPNVLLEALACGRRVVATRGGRDSPTSASTTPALGRWCRPADPAAPWQPRCGKPPLTKVQSRPPWRHDGARGGWDDSAAKLEASLARAVAEHPGAEQPKRHPRGTHGAAATEPGRLSSVVQQRLADALPRRLLARHGPRQLQRIALTFDDGPDEMTDAYLDVLARSAPTRARPSS